MSAPLLAARVRPSRQRGSILVTVAVGLSVMVALLGAVDLGLLYYYKREYQKAADLAALAGSRQLSVGCTEAAAAGIDNANANLSEHAHDTPVIQPGVWKTTTDPRFVAGCTGDQNAVRALIFGSVPTIFLGTRNISAEAIARALEPVAQLRIRSTVADLDEGLLNDVTGSLLGGAVSLSLASWEGLLGTDINLLSYLDALALELGVDAGNYDQVLGTDVTLGQLLGVAADVLNDGGGTGDVGAAVGGLDQLSVLSLPAFSPLLQLGDLLNIQSGTDAAGLDTGLNVLDLVQGSVQLASSQCAACIALPIDLPGVAGVQVRTQIVEPPQLSAIGRPELARADPLGPDRIFVRTAQARTLVSIELPVVGALLDTVQALLNSSLLSGLSGTVNSLLSLDLVGVVSSLSCVLACDFQKDVVDVRVLPSPRIDVYIELGEGQAHVTDYSCDEGKSLEVPTQTAAADIRIGSLGTSSADAAAKVFAKPSTTPQVDPVGLLDIGSYRARYRCTLLLICNTTWLSPTGTWVPNQANAQRTAFSGGGIGIKAIVPVAGTSGTEDYSDPPSGDLPDLGEEPSWHDVSSTQIVDSLSDALTDLELQFYEPSNGNLLGGVLSLVGATANTLVDTLSGIIDAALGPLLDPLVDFLVSGLGLGINQVDVGANLSCEGGGGTLVE